MPVAIGSRDSWSPLQLEEKTKPKTEQCFPSFRFSTSSATTKGETAYRVVPATATVCDLAGHHFYGELDWIDWNWPYGKGIAWGQECQGCGKRRHKVTKEEWIIEGE